jgi:hypothetical protein
MNYFIIIIIINFFSLFGRALLMITLMTMTRCRRVGHGQVKERLFFFCYSLSVSNLQIAGRLRNAMRKPRAQGQPAICGGM